MSLWRQVTHGVRALIGGRGVDAERDEEIRHFVDESAAELEREGLSPDQARRTARLRAGNPLAIREEVRAAGWEHQLDTLIADVRYGCRRLWNNPSLTAVTAATLGLGIGAVTAIISVAGPVLVQTLPFPHAERIRAVWDTGNEGGRAAIAFGNFIELQERSRSFESMAATRSWQPTLSGAGVPERLDGMAVSGDYFKVFGMAPRLGRDFAAAEDQPRGAPVVIISDRLWRRRFAADAGIIGRPITLNGSSYEVIGVMPAAFEHRLMPRAEVWRALQYDRTLPSAQGREWGHHLQMVARLRPGASIMDANQDLSTIARDRIPRFARPPWALMPNGFRVDSLHEDLTYQARPAMVAVTAAALLLLLIACVNVVNLLLGRDAQRHDEFAMRAALGAGRGRLVRQLLTETLLLAVIGGGLGLLMAGAAIRGIALLGPAGSTQLERITLDPSVFAVALLVTVGAGMAVGLAPALSNRDLKGSMPHGARSTPSSFLARRALVTAEVAVALVLLVGAGLLLQSLGHLFAISPGFEGNGVLTAQVQVSGPRFSSDEMTHRYFQQVLEAVRSVRGVDQAALTSQLPLSGDSDIYGAQFESAAPLPGVEDSGSGAFRYAVTPSYFDAMKIPIARGRALSEHDTRSAPLAAVISESLARRRFGDRDPLGQRLHIGPSNRPWFTVVGVAGDVKQLSLETAQHDAVYVAPSQWHFADSAFWVIVRSGSDVASLAPAIRGAIWSVDKDQPIVRLGTLDRIVIETARERRFALLLFEVFGAAALLLTMIGVYGVVSGGVTERRREIGVRTALGASRASILQLVIGQGVAMAAAGVAVGSIVAAFASRALSTLLFGISPLDPRSYLVVAASLVLLTVTACWLPALRAARLDPVATLRAE